MITLSKYSPWYFYRLFVKLLGMTPAVYIRRLRLSKSALRLRDEKVRIIDVALDAGFDSVDGYQRAFYKEFGCNPCEYSICPIPIYLFKPYGIKYSKAIVYLLDAMYTEKIVPELFEEIDEQI